MQAMAGLHRHLLPGERGALRRPGSDAGDAEARLCRERIASMRAYVIDVGGALDELGRRGTDPHQRAETQRLLDRLWAVLTQRPPPFARRPVLQITEAPLRAWRAHGDFDDVRGSAAPLVDPVTQRVRAGHEQGAWLSELVDRDRNAVLSTWGNPMDIVDEQEVPVGSVVLRGPAAPMRARSAWDGARDRPPEVRAGGAMQICHLGQCGRSMPVQAWPAARHVLTSYTIGPGGSRLREV